MAREMGAWAAFLGSAKDPLLSSFKEPPAAFKEEIGRMVKKCLRSSGVFHADQFIEALRSSGNHLLVHRPGFSVLGKKAGYEIYVYASEEERRLYALLYDSRLKIPLCWGHDCTNWEGLSEDTLLCAECQQKVPESSTISVEEELYDELFKMTVVSDRRDSAAHQTSEYERGVAESGSDTAYRKSTICEAFDVLTRRTSTGGPTQSVADKVANMDVAEKLLKGRVHPHQTVRITFMPDARTFFYRFPSDPDWIPLCDEIKKSSTICIEKHAPGKNVCVSHSDSMTKLKHAVALSIGEKSWTTVTEKGILDSLSKTNGEISVGKTGRIRRYGMAGEIRISGETAASYRLCADFAECRNLTLTEFCTDCINKTGRWFVAVYKFKDVKGLDWYISAKVQDPLKLSVIEEKASIVSTVSTRIDRIQNIVRNGEPIRVGPQRITRSFDEAKQVELALIMSIYIEARLLGADVNLANSAIGFPEHPASLIGTVQELCILKHINCRFAVPNAREQFQPDSERVTYFEPTVSEPSHRNKCDRIYEITHELVGRTYIGLLQYSTATPIANPPTAALIHADKHDQTMARMIPRDMFLRQAHLCEIPSRKHGSPLAIETLFQVAVFISGRERFEEAGSPVLVNKRTSSFDFRSDHWIDQLNNALGIIGNEKRLIIQRKPLPIVTRIENPWIICTQKEAEKLIWSDNPRDTSI